MWPGIVAGNGLVLFWVLLYHRGQKTGGASFSSLLSVLF